VPDKINKESANDDKQYYSNELLGKTTNSSFGNDDIIYSSISIQNLSSSIKYEVTTPENSDGTLSPFSSSQLLSLSPKSAVVARFIPAQPSHDVWSLGAILFELFCGETLFHSNFDDNICATQLKELHDFTPDFKQAKLSKISNLLSRNLVSQMLQRNPNLRPSLQQILQHPFLSGKSVTRLAGEAAEFDVFLSYRVSSDSVHVEELFKKLTAAGIKVWWDKQCLEPGEKSRFVCFILCFAIYVILT
jgi:serine/threonine protein kinase